MTEKEALFLIFDEIMLSIQNTSGWHSQNLLDALSLIVLDYPEWHGYKELFLEA